MRLMLRLTSGFAGLLTLLITGLLVAPRAAGPPARLAFASSQGSNYDIFAMLPDGSGSQRLTTYSGQDLFPSWSPDQQWIAFASTRGGNIRIFKMRVRDGWAQPLTIIPGADQEPAWSPDGRWIAYVTDHLGNTDIYRVPASGGRSQRLTTDPGHDDAPAWSPDGARIAYAATRENATLLADSGGARRFANYDIVVMNADGGNLQRLTTDPANDAQPAWSPDGAWIAFVSDRDGDRDIYAMRADGSELRLLTTHPGIDESPAWSPDGAWIAFVSDRDGDRNIYAMRPDGSDPRALTHSPDQDKTPVWSYPVRSVYRAALAAAVGTGLAGFALAAPLRAQFALSRQGRRKPSP